MISFLIKRKYSYSETPPWKQWDCRIKLLEIVRNESRHMKNEVVLSINAYFLIYNPVNYPHLFMKWGCKCKTAFDLLVFHNDF